MDTARKKLRQDKILNGSYVKVIFSISLPLIIYNYFTFLYVFFDTLMVSHKGFNNVSAVVYLDQIKGMFAGLSSSLAAGGCIVVARYLGAKNYEKAKRCANNLVYLAIILALAMIAIVVPLARPILVLANTTETLINIGLKYFIVQIITLGVVFYNSVYIGLEKAKGNTLNILYLNIIVMITKLVFSGFFVYVLGHGIVMVAVATLIAQSALAIFATLIMRNKNNELRLTKIKLEKEYLKPIFRIFFPIFLGQFAFSFGKVIVNSLALPKYGEIAIGGFGVVNQTVGISSSITSAIEETEPAIISQNIGNNNMNRAVQFFKVTMLVDVSFAVLGFIVLSLIQNFIFGLFISGENQVESLKVTKDIFFYQRADIISCAVAATCMGFIYGLGLSKLAMILNICRLFLFRIPILLYLIHYTNVDHKGLGIAMGASNIFFALMAIFMALFLYRKFKHNKLHLKEM